MEEYNWRGVKEIVKCPKCDSDDVESVNPFDYVKQCNECGHQFVTGAHN